VSGVVEDMGQADDACRAARVAGGQCVRMAGKVLGQLSKRDSLGRPRFLQQNVDVVFE
jgi:hypothetical protein